MRRSPVVLALLLALASASCRSSAPRPPVTDPAAPTAATGAAPGDQRDAWLTQFARGYFPGRSGQLFMVSREGEFIVDRNPLYAFMHGSPWAYDTHVPLLLYGPPFIRTLVWNERVSQQDVAPTLAALLGTAPPATAIGRPLREALAPAATRPRVVALLVLDGTRADYFDTYRDVLPTLSRLRAEGAWYSQAHVSSIPTLTAVGHANLGTGAEPRTHGLAVNYLFNRVTGKSQEAYDALDPGEMFALTLA
ncbi:MAG: alkaline phosphatase family protein, partial [Vicinamibacteria bacterium]